MSIYNIDTLIPWLKQKEEVKPKGPLGKLKEAVDDKEEQMAILSTFVRLGIFNLGRWNITLNYVLFLVYKTG